MYYILISFAPDLIYPNIHTYMTFVYKNMFRFKWESKLVWYRSIYFNTQYYWQSSLHPGNENRIKMHPRNFLQYIFGLTWNFIWHLGPIDKICIHCPMCIDFSKWLAIQYISCSVKFEEEMISQCNNNLYHLIVKNILYIVTDGISNV